LFRASWTIIDVLLYHLLCVGDKRWSHFETCPRPVRDVEAVLPVEVQWTSHSTVYGYVVEIANAVPHERFVLERHTDKAAHWMTLA
jgi:hypothetical protein